MAKEKCKVLRNYSTEVKKDGKTEVIVRRRHRKDNDGNWIVSKEGYKLPTIIEIEGAELKLALKNKYVELADE